MTIHLVEEPRSTKTTDLTGQTYGKLKIQSFAGYYYGGGQRYAAWCCICACGTVKVVRGDRMKIGRTVSCGCHKNANTSARFRKHGHRYPCSKEYRAWIGMKGRCLHTSHRGYKNYGGRGITVCKRWLDAFENFLADVGLAPSPEHTIDRFPDQNGNYEPGNVRWATRTEQAYNRRSNVLLTHDEVTLPAIEWAKRLGCRIQTILARKQIGWTDSEAVSIPVKFGNKRSRMGKIT